MVGNTPVPISKVAPEATVADAVSKMRGEGCGSVLVPLVSPAVASTEQAFGIFTERDFVKVLAGGLIDAR